MPFIIEDGTGRTDATTYVSAEQADSIIAQNIHESTWWDLSTTQKKNVLNHATSLLDTYAGWGGRKTTQASARAWPRTGVMNRDGVLIDAHTMPRALIEGTVELARVLSHGDRTTERDQDGLSRLKADVIELEFRNIRTAIIPASVWAILGPLAARSGGIRR